MGLSVVSEILSPNGSKARYGIAYLRALCAQAGLGLTETSPDEDVLAVDCDVKFREGNVPVQVKCTSGLKIAGRSASWSAEEHWLRAWDASYLPVYFVLVIVPVDLPNWLEHQPEGTFHRTAAFWCRLQVADIASKITVPKKQRLTSATFDEWHEDLLAVFVPKGST